MADSTDTDQETRLQFERADYREGAPDADALRCSACQRELTYEYFELNGQPICESCRFEVEQARDSESATGRLLRALAAGLCGGVLGAGLYYAVLALTGYEIGLIAIAVGFLVGAGVRWGSRGRGGLPYQIIASSLTYVAIVSTYIPFMLGSAPAGQSSPPQPERPGTSAASTGTPPAGGPNAVESQEEFTERITAELRLSDARAAEAFAEGNAARGAGDLPRAERLYRDVLQLQPRFVHARRRLCGVLVDADRRDDALPLCRQAVQQDPSLFNLETLVVALSAPSHGRPAPSADLVEAMSQADLLLNRPDLRELDLAMLCQSAVNAGALELFRRCSARLDEVAPLSLPSASFGWLLALSDGDFDRAEARLAQARKAGLNDEAYADALAVAAKARAGPTLGERLLDPVRLLLWAMALPFLLGVRNVIGIAIIGFAVFQAWTMNRRVPLQFGGPYRVGAAGTGATMDGGADAV